MQQHGSSSVMSIGQHVKNASKNSKPSSGQSAKGGKPVSKVNVTTTFIAEGRPAVEYNPNLPFDENTVASIIDNSAIEPADLVGGIITLANKLYGVKMTRKQVQKLSLDGVEIEEWSSEAAFNAMFNQKGGQTELNLSQATLNFVRWAKLGELGWKQLEKAANAIRKVNGQPQYTGEHYILATVTCDDAGNTVEHKAQLFLRQGEELSYVCDIERFDPQDFQVAKLDEGKTVNQTVLGVLKEGQKSTTMMAIFGVTGAEYDLHRHNASIPALNLAYGMSGAKSIVIKNGRDGEHLGELESMSAALDSTYERMAKFLNPFAPNSSGVGSNN